MLNFVKENQENDEKNDNDNYRDCVKKMSALYAEEWKCKTPDQLIYKYFNKEIPEFLQLKKKTFECDSVR